MWLLSLFLPIVACLPSRDQGTLHEAARDLLSASMNSSVEPCDDFFDFACGGWLEQHEIPAAGYVSTASINENSVNQKLIDLLSDKQTHASKSVELVKHLYQSCMDVEAVEADKGKAMIKLVNRTDPHLDLTGLLVNAHRRNVDPKMPLTIFFALDVTPKRRIRAHSEIKLHMQPTLSARYSRLPTYKDALFEILSAYTTDLGEEVVADRVRRDVQDIIDMDALLEQGGSGRDPDLDISTLDRKLPAVDWHRYLELLLGSEQLPFVKKLRAIEMDKFTHWAKVLNSTSPRVIKNYFVVYYSILYNLELDQRYSALYNAIVQPKKPRREQCLDLTRALTSGQAMSALYVSKHFDPTIKATVEEMASDIQEAFIEILNENQWMDAKAKENAVKKAKEMIIHIGYDTSLLSNTALDAYYSKANVSINDSFAEQVEKWVTWASYDKYRNQFTPANRSEFGLRNLFPIEMRANNMLNTINVAAAFIQPPFYSKAMPAAFNYGALGVIIAHEMAHGFAEGGKHEDTDEMNNNRTWSDDTSKEFQKVKNCIVQQYDEVKIPEIEETIDGTKTSEENMADLGGVKAAFRAYQRHIKKHGSGPKVPRSTDAFYSDEQLFFLSHATAWCSKETPAILAHLRMADSHAPFRYRVLYRTKRRLPMRSTVRPAHP